MTMTKNQYRRILEEFLEISQAKAGQALGIDARTSRRYALGGVIPGPVDIALRMMVKFKLSPEDVEEIRKAKLSEL